MGKNNLQHCTMRKKGISYTTTYLLWMSKYTNTFALHGIYFPDTSGITYDGCGKYWEMPYSTMLHEGTYNQVKDEFMNKIMEKTSEGYSGTVESHSKDD